MTCMLSPELQTKLSQIKLLALDVDGVLTDGGLYYTERGEEFKKFNVKDGLGLKRVMQSGIEVAFITAGSSQSTVHRAERLGIKHLFISVEDKRITLIHLCKQLGTSLSQVAYIGDDLVDLTVMAEVGFPMSVDDAMPQCQELALYVTQKGGGQGAVREVCDLLIQCLNSDSPEEGQSQER